MRRPLWLASLALDPEAPLNERRKAWEGLHAKVDLIPSFYPPDEAGAAMCRDMIRKALALEFPCVVSGQSFRP